MSAIWKILGKAFASADTEGSFRHGLFKAAKAPNAKTHPTLSEFRDVHLRLADAGCFATRGEVWEIHWIFSRKKKSEGQTLRQCMDQIHPVVRGASTTIEPVFGLCAIDSRFRKACHSLRDQPVEEMRTFLTRQSSATVNENEFFGPNFGDVQNADAAKVQQVMRDSAVVKALRRVQLIAWIQPSPVLMKALKKHLGHYACASGFVPWPETSVPEITGMTTELTGMPPESSGAGYSPQLFSLEQVAALLSDDPVADDLEDFLPADESLKTLVGLLELLVERTHRLREQRRTNRSLRQTVPVGS